MGALSSSLRDRVIERLGLAAPPVPDLAGLFAVYNAWCSHIPFDNVRKMIALRTAGAPLPGLTAEDFLSAWLDHGTGGTCWPSSDALWALLCASGFDARRIVASMGDTGYGSHGTVKARVDAANWLVDSSLLTNQPALCADVVHINTDPVWPIEIEPLDGTHLIWFDGVPATTPLTCRILQDPADPAWFVQAYEASRERSPFNARLYVRKNFPHEVRLLVGSTRFSKTAAGVESRTLTRAEVPEALVSEFAMSDDIVNAWVLSGSLDDSLVEVAGPPRPVPTLVRPSLRAEFTAQSNRADPL